MAGNFFYFALLMAAGLAGWIGVQQLAIGVLIIDYGVATFWGYIPEVTYPLIGLLNVFMIVNVWLYRPLTPNY